jgi:hypothetical protein
VSLAAKERLAGTLRRQDEVALLATDRDRIARSLHNQVISRLYATGLALQAVRSLVSDPLVQARVTAAVEELDAAVQDIRTTIFALEAPRAASRGLGAEVLDLLAGAAPRLNFEPTIRFDGPLDQVTDHELKARALAALSPRPRQPRPGWQGPRGHPDLGRQRAHDQRGCRDLPPVAVPARRGARRVFISPGAFISPGWPASPSPLRYGLSCAARRSANRVA